MTDENGRMSMIGQSQHTSESRVKSILTVFSPFLPLSLLSRLLSRFLPLFFPLFPFSPPHSRTAAAGQLFPCTGTDGDGAATGDAR